MVYIVQQTEGKLVEASKALFEAFKAGDFAEVERVYREATGEEPPFPADTRHTWWKYNAIDIVRRFHPRNKRQEKALKKIYSTTRSDEQAAYLEAQLAKRSVGGTWEYFYEY